MFIRNGGLWSVRAAVLGNGRLCLGWDRELCLREMFWPRVGLANHVQENRRNGLMLWCSGCLHELAGAGFKAKGRYLAGMGFEWTLEDPGLGVRVLVTDWVDPVLPVWARQLRVSLPPGTERAAIYSVQAFALGENTVGEEAAYEVERGRLYHFKGRCWVAVKFAERRERDWGRASASVRRVAAVAKVRDGGVRFSPEDGAFTGRNVDHGLIESAVGLVWAGCPVLEAEYLLAFGRDKGEADARLDDAGDAERVAERSRRWWTGRDGPSSVSAKVLASHCDSGGGVIASCDSDIMGDFRDHYRYVWPRDAAMCTSSLLKSGFPEYARRYLGFCAKALSGRGFFFQRYRADGTRGSGWHPWDLPPGDLPIQEDETALSLVSAGEYLQATGDLKSVRRVYAPFIQKAARFILAYTTEDGTLVRPSYDLWEERRGIFAFTQACCLAGLLAASNVAAALGEEGDSREFAHGASLLLRGLVLHLSDEERGFCRGIPCDGAAVPAAPRDWTEDASLFLLPLLLPSPASAGVSRARLGEPGAEDMDEAWRRATVTWERQRAALAVRLPGASVPGFARYRGDWYFRPHGAGDLPGNPWLVTTAWYVLAGAKLGLIGKTEVGQYVSWFQSVGSEAGLLPEQVSCLTGQPLSVSPLAWSHAAHLDLLLAADLLHSGTEAGAEYSGELSGR